MIETNWYSLTEISAGGTDEISAVAEIHPDSPWFSGHFPGNPILPGIAQLGMVSDLLKKTTAYQLKIDSVKQVRFKQIILPDARILIKIQPVKDRAHHYSFRMTVKDAIVCRGVIVTHKINQKIKGDKTPYGC
jgi:3-hydroxymyristoyl/3-hydroxydecanoyl-(acyl carrier protein) dehydratase